jgi:HSP20 family protein
MTTSLIRRSLLGHPSELEGALDSLFQGVFGAVVPTRWPSVEWEEEDGALVLRCDLPGVDPKDLEVTLEGDTLTIAGERKAERRGRRFSEIRYGRFRRVVSVPEGLDPEKVSAAYTKGVLEVTLPLPGANRPRRVPVETDSQEPEKAA